MAVPPDRPTYRLKRVWLSKKQEEGYYYGFANSALWPLCHVAYRRPLFREDHWRAYRAVNLLFAEKVAEEVRDQASFVFIQDYHLALLPRLLRARWQCEDGRSWAAFEPGLGLLNRAGHVQGGAGVGLVVAAARAASGRPTRLASAHVQFVRPVLARRLQVAGRLVRAGRRVSFATVELEQDAQVVATGSVTLVDDQAS